jgi:hypothetical protein
VVDGDLISPRRTGHVELEPPRQAQRVEEASGAGPSGPEVVTPRDDLQRRAPKMRHEVPGVDAHPGPDAAHEAQIDGDTHLGRGPRPVIDPIR